LGGKSPVIIHDSFPIAEAAKRLAFGKCMNAGQICVSPDYILCPRDKVNTFVSEFRKRIEAAYPSFKDNKDWTGIINERQLSRLQGVLKDAEEKGARILPINPASETFEGTRKMPVTMVLNATEDMRILQEELFGPLLPILPYDDLDEAISYVNARPRPLALYYFDYDKARGQHIVENTHSGGVCINDTLSHVMSDDVPFGGIGPSGMGHYHGKEGFLNFSKAKAVVAKGKVYMNDRVGPPWGRLMYRSLMLMLALKLKKRKV
jgi:coniferyl-aldehyde dehydrogenase